MRQFIYKVIIIIFIFIVGFEFTIGDLDIEKQMTEFTFKQVISWINIKLITWNNFG